MRKYTEQQGQNSHILISHGRLTIVFFIDSLRQPLLLMMDLIRCQSLLRVLWNISLVPKLPWTHLSQHPSICRNSCSFSPTPVLVLCNNRSPDRTLPLNNTVCTPIYQTRILPWVSERL